MRLRQNSCDRERSGRLRLDVGRQLQYTHRTIHALFRDRGLASEHQTEDLPVAVTRTTCARPVCDGLWFVRESTKNYRMQRLDATVRHLGLLPCDTVVAFDV